MKRALTAFIALSLLTGSLAMADPGNGRDHRRDDHRHTQREHSGNDRHHDRRDDRRNDYRHDRRDNNRGDYHGRHDRFRVGEYRRPHGYYHHQWRRGDRVPHAWSRPVYVMQDYHVYHLRRPPRGYHWVRVNNDVLLTAIATGLVADVVFGIFY